MLTVPLDAESDTPLYEQIYNYIKKEIINGSLSYQDKLPSSRSLAANLQISRNTVDLAYGQLVSEGYIVSVPKSGYYVCRIGSLMHLGDSRKPVPEPRPANRNTIRYDFNPFAIDIANFPYEIFRRLSRNVLNESNHELFLSGDRQGDPDFRSAIAKYLHVSRGAACTPDSIVVGAGTGYLLQLLFGLLSDPAGQPRLVAFENPTFMKACQIAATLGHQTTALPLDSEGLRVDALEASGADIAYITPSHQYPIGTIMSVRRRMDLLDWAAAAPGRYIIEDDHDSEFRYKGRPIPPLQGMDTTGRVIYMGTFSRAVTPALRAGYMVLPEELLARYKKEFSCYSCTVSRFDQAILTDFITLGHFERHLNRMRTIYRAKHDLLLKSLRMFGTEIRITGEHAGLHLTVGFLRERSQEELIQKAEKAGIRLYGLNEHYIEPVPEHIPTLLIGFANLREEEITAGIRLLYSITHDA